MHRVHVSRDGTDYLVTYVLGYRFNQRRFVDEWFECFLITSTSAKIIALVKLEGGTVEFINFWEVLECLR